MRNETKPESFDCVKSMRETRDRISAEIADMSYPELSRWMEACVRDDPFFARIPKFRKTGAAAEDEAGRRSGGWPARRPQRSRRSCGEPPTGGRIRDC